MSYASRSTLLDNTFFGCQLILSCTYYIQEEKQQNRINRYTMTLAFAIIASKVSQYPSGGHPHSPVTQTFADAEHGGGVSSTLEHIWHSR